MSDAVFDVVESPSWDEWPSANRAIAPVGVFILVKVDPVASVASLEDEEITQAAAALPTHQWVLAVITGITAGMILHAGGRENMSIIMQTFGQGLPSAKPIASIPIAPSPQVYDDRPPLQFNAPLPWPNIYIHTYYSSSLFVSRILHSASGCETRLTEEQVCAVVDASVTDRFYYDELPPVSEKPRETPEPPPLPSNPSDDSGESDSSSDSDEPLHAQELNEIATKMDRLRLYGEICLDPSICPGPLGAPADMVEPIRRIKELWAAWEERRTTEILARRPETDAWARGVTNALAGPDGVDAESEEDNPQASVEEDEILPEDAVDERFEKARAARLVRRTGTGPQFDEPAAKSLCAKGSSSPASGSPRSETQPLATTRAATQVYVPDLQAENVPSNPRESTQTAECTRADSVGAAAPVSSVECHDFPSCAVHPPTRTANGHLQGGEKSPRAAMAHAIARLKCLFTRRRKRPS